MHRHQKHAEDVRRGLHDPIYGVKGQASEGGEVPFIVVNVLQREEKGGGEEVAVVVAPPPVNITLQRAKD